jgi:hypothetical protein
VGVGIGVGVGVGGAVAGTATPTTIGPITVRASAFGSASKRVCRRSAGFSFGTYRASRWSFPQDWSRWTPRKPVADPRRH